MGDIRVKTLNKKVSEATVSEAIEYHSSPDRFMYAINKLDISIHWQRADHWITKLVKKYEWMLDEARIKV